MIDPLVLRNDTTAQVAARYQTRVITGYAYEERNTNGGQRAIQSPIRRVSSRVDSLPTNRDRRGPTRTKQRSFFDGPRRGKWPGFGLRWYRSRGRDHRVCGGNYSLFRKRDRLPDPSV
jgi:hypothetical protein